MTKDQKLQFAMALVTGAVAVATLWLGIETKRMANSTGGLLAVEEQPYLAIKDLCFKYLVFESTTNTLNTQFLATILFHNPSRVPVKYEMTQVIVTFDSRTVENPTYFNMGTTIYPGDVMAFGCPMIKNVNLDLLPKNGTIEYSMKYHSLGSHSDIEYTAHKKLFYQILSVNPDNIEWFFQIDEGTALPNKRLHFTFLPWRQKRRGGVTLDFSQNVWFFIMNNPIFTLIIVTVSGLFGLAVAIATSLLNRRFQSESYTRDILDRKVQAIKDLYIEALSKLDYLLHVQGDVKQDESSIRMG